jgi:hypothetical protein
MNGRVCKPSCRRGNKMIEDDDETEHGNMIGGADLSVLRQIGTSRK